MAVVYQHKKKDTGEVFYIGIGSTIRRAKSTYKRSKLWHNIVNKHGYEIEVTHKDVSWEEACSIERYLISFYGRRDLKQGTLINMTDGGDGRFGAIVSKETRQKMSRTRKGMPSPLKGVKRSKDIVDKVAIKLREYWKNHKKEPMSEETKKKLSEINKGKIGTWVGRKHSEDSLEKMRLSHGRGKDNKRFGAKHKEETKQKMRESAKNRDNSNYGRKKTQEELIKLKEIATSRPKSICPHCKKIGQHNIMVRWHFDNCKLKNKL